MFGDMMCKTQHTDAWMHGHRACDLYRVLHCLHFDCRCSGRSWHIDCNCTATMFQSRDGLAPFHSHKLRRRLKPSMATRCRPCASRSAAPQGWMTSSQCIRCAQSKAWCCSMTVSQRHWGSLVGTCAKSVVGSTCLHFIMCAPPPSLPLQTWTGCEVVIYRDSCMLHVVKVCGICTRCRLLELWSGPCA